MKKRPNLNLRLDKQNPELPEHVVYENRIIRYEAGNHQITLPQAFEYINDYNKHIGKISRQQGVHIPRLVLADLVGRAKSDLVYIYFGLRALQEGDRREINLVFTDRVLPKRASAAASPAKKKGVNGPGFHNQDALLFEFTNGFPPDCTTLALETAVAGAPSSKPTLAQLERLYEQLDPKDQRAFLRRRQK